MTEFIKGSGVNMEGECKNGGEGAVEIEGSYSYPLYD